MAFGLIEIYSKIIKFEQVGPEIHPCIETILKFHKFTYGIWFDRNLLKDHQI